MQTQLPPLEKYSEKGERNEAKFEDFVEELKLRFGLESGRTKIRYFRSYLTELALDAFLGILAYLRKEGI